MNKIFFLLPLICLVLQVQSQLKQVVSIFRHGARYTLNGYYDGNEFKDLWGQLNGVGMRQHQGLGKYMRQDYINKIPFLSSDYKSGEIQVFSSDRNRTFQSIASQLYGLYGLGQGQKLFQVDSTFHLPPYSNKTDSEQQIFALPEGFQQIPVIFDNDIVIGECKNKQLYFQKNIDYQLQTYKQMNLTYFPFLKRMAGIFNISIQSFNFSNCARLFDTLTSDYYMGRPFPKEFSEEDFKNMAHLHFWLSFFRIKFNLAKAYNTGKTRKMITDFDDRIVNNNKTSKWTFLSTHDTDTTALMNALNITSSECIEELYRKGSTEALNCYPNTDYAMSLIFQLHTDDKGQNYYVKVRFNGKYVYLCEKRTVTCDYQQWKKRIERQFVNVDLICSGPAVQN